jgi:hypothetical protein
MTRQALFKPQAAFIAFPALDESPQGLEESLSPHLPRDESRLRLEERPSPAT